LNPTNTPEAIDKVLDTLILEIGAQVTRDYESKHGMWEGMSISNEKTRIVAKATLSAMVFDKVIGADAYIDYSQRELYGVGQIAALEAINAEKDLQRQFAMALGFDMKEGE